MNPVDPSDDDSFDAIASCYGHLAAAERCLQNVRVLLKDDQSIALAAEKGHLAVVEQLLGDTRFDPSGLANRAVRMAAANGHLAVVERLLQDKRVDPSADNNSAVQNAAAYGYVRVVDRLLRDPRVDPSFHNNFAVAVASLHGHFAVVDRLLEDERVKATVAIAWTCPERRKRFECRERLTEICIGLQEMALPAWITVQILDAARPWSTLPLHSKWNLVCAVKHFHDRRVLP
jgi:hypothetical protein